ncbi:MAG TPA: rod shape-determining protein RodA [Magnetospirillaceae bacterium]|nr:rod shape-determining protein RodA [Magnetospirillaceae bacterium]
MTVNLKDLFRDLDWYIFAAVLVLMIVGIIFIFSSGVSSTGVVISTEYLRQIAWVLLGSVLLFIVAMVDHKRVKDLSFILYAALIALLVYTRMFGRVVNGARSWIGVGELGIQPSEFAKVATIFYLSRFLEGTRHTMPGFRRLLGTLVIAGVPMFLVLSQPDFGTALVFLPILFTMAYLCGIERRYLVFLGSVVTLTFLLVVLPIWEKSIATGSMGMLPMLYEGAYFFVILGVCAVTISLAVWGYLSSRRRYYYWIAYAFLVILVSLVLSGLGRAILKDYQIMRLIVFLDPAVDPRGSGWNIMQSITAIGSGGLTGRGFLRGTQGQYRFLPQQSTDFIFSILSEEWGFIGGLLVFSLYGVILFRTLALLNTVKDPFAVGLLAGLTGMMFFHFMVNVGMTMGIMPITGIPLFFLSYGGSSLWSVLVGIGLILGISARRFQS